MPADGLFDIVRAKPRRTATATSRLILICSGGRLFGADPKGRVYMGKLLVRRRPAICLSILNGTCEIFLKGPARRRSGLQGPSLRIPITGEVDPQAQSQNATVRLGGQPIDIEITYLGPLPR